MREKAPEPAQASRFSRRASPMRHNFPGKAKGRRLFLHTGPQIALGGLCLLVSFGWLLQAFIEPPNWFPVNLHSLLAADYSADPPRLRLPAVHLDLIRDILQDYSTPGNPDLPGATDRIATLQGELNTPVPSVTRLPGEPTQTRNPSQTPTHSASATTSTPAASTMTPSATSTAASLPTIPSTATPTAGYLIPTMTVTSRATGQPTPTLRPPTQPAPTTTNLPEVSPTPRPNATPTPTNRPPTQPPPTEPPNPYPEPTRPPYP